jgi:HPt (histidine-containing phosphotransfer) domain-containing protein
MSSFQDLRRSFNATFAAVASSSSLPEFPSPLVAKAQDLMLETRQFIAGNPPASIQAPASQARDIITIAESLPTLQGMLTAKDYIAADGLASKLATSAGTLGGPTLVVLKNIQAHCIAQLENVKKLREEAVALAKEGNKKEAAEKLSEALEIMPNPEIDQQISDLLAR